MTDYISNSVLIWILTFEKISNDTSNDEPIILVPNGKVRYLYRPIPKQCFAFFLSLIFFKVPLIKEYIIKSLILKFKISLQNLNKPYL